jgi:hypothetical protein
MELRDLGLIHLLTVALTAVIVIGTVLLHYESLSWFGRVLKARVLHHRAKIAALIFAQLGLHIIEIWLFAAGYLLMIRSPAYGAIEPSAHLGFLDLVYFSAMTYTTVGYGDLVPSGSIRFLCGMEALTGFVLITWSASFTFLEMQRYWGRD